MYCHFFSVRNSKISPGFLSQSCIVLAEEEEFVSGLLVRNIWDDRWLRHNPALFPQKFLLTLHVVLSFYYLTYFFLLVRDILTFYTDIVFSWRYFLNALHGDFWFLSLSAKISIWSYYFCFIWHLHLGKSQGRKWQIHQLKTGNPVISELLISR